MQYGAMNFPVAPVLDEIDAFARMGFDYLELAMDPPMAHHSILAAERKAIVNALKANQMGLVCHLPTFVSTADLTESIRRASVTEMRQSLGVAADLGAAKAVLHPSMAGGMGIFVLETVKGYLFDFLGEMVTAAEQLGMVLCLENMFPRYRMGVAVEDFEEIFEAFPALKMTLDTGHANIDDARGRRLKALAQRFEHRINHLHVSDNRGRVDDHLAVGQGTVRFDALVTHLKRVGYDQTITFEVFDENRRMLVESRERIKTLFAG
ncbi:TIM barrel protein, AP endonuclease family 2/xylose isomerase-like protein family [Desulfosarcina cetonica]|uniref:sugar phosphate isomerase/epimerase family protein n=1 Tax=Desulfosarcina cetonica TaxID=90730 RepID=UPI0006D1EEB0|nr:sugar phosphate isomerase/epimerase [Desulfosarcina cetonica]VTR68851.1 TIM barrel protein, AP endonuclease family 2/xylose isomerase-like protein family [Desulfosarcina cetonica]